MLEQAKAEGADLVVVGSHGKGAMESFLLGSVSERVARYAPCSVLVARSDQLRRAVVGLDGSETAAAALELLTRLPLPNGAELRVVHVLQPREVPPGEKQTLAPEDRERLAEADRVIQGALERLRATGWSVHGEVRCGATAASLVATAGETGADLIVLGVSSHAGPGPFFLGCVSGWVLIHAPCSVLLARKTAREPAVEAGLPRSIPSPV
jgi:nucleotide-binding universal stress UspA family protein